MEAFDKEFYNLLNETLDQLGWKPEEQGALSGDLNDIHETCKDYLDNIQKLISVEKNKEDIVPELCLAIQFNMEHLKFHLKSGLPLMKKLVKMVYSNYK